MAGGATGLELARQGMAAFIDLLMPPLCPGCKEPVARAGLHCASCWTSLHDLGATRCDQCAAPLPLAWSAETLCLACVREPPPFRRARAAFAYRSVARTTVLAFKNGSEHLAAGMAEAMARAASGLAAADCVVVPVPLHRWRLARRGYNQSAWLARALAARLGRPLAVDALVRHRATPSTRGLGREARARAMAGAFRVAPRRHASIAGHPILLVDDVMTSGATAAAAARALLRAGATAVDLLVYARVAAEDASGYAGLPLAGEAHGPR